MRMLAAALALIAAMPALAQGLLPTPPRSADFSMGPFDTLVIRGVTIIEGNGGPPFGPADIVIRGDRIAEIRSAGTPGLPMQPNRPPQVTGVAGAREIDATGMYVLPGFVDMHGHNGDEAKAPDPSYGYRLWLAHGVTTVRGVPLFNDPTRALLDKRRSAAGEIAAPRFFVYQTLGSGWAKGPTDTPAKAREWVRWAKTQGIDGI
ncbi:MAG: amidohydrolase, partial [Sandaracinobacter sp.]